MQGIKLEIGIKLRAAVRYDQEAEVWVSWCPALDVYSQGTTRQRAQSAIEEALLMYVRHCFSKKKLGQILNRRGFAPVGPHDEPMGDDEAFDEFINVRVVSERPQYTPSIFDVTVPLPLVAAAA